MDPPTYSECESRLKTFVETCLKTPSRIYFLYFGASKDPTPFIKGFFGTWKTNQNTYYVIAGRKCNYIYVYQDHGLERLIRLGSGGPSGFNAQALKTADVENAFKASVLPSTSMPSSPDDIWAKIGNHIDFAVTSRTREHPLLVFENHMTSYEIAADGSCQREAPSCNFSYVEVAKYNPAFCDTIDDFKRIKQESWVKPQLYLSEDITMKKVYDDKWITAVFNLTRIALGKFQDFSGGAMKKYHVYNKRRYIVKTGPRGGEYILINSRKVYLKVQKPFLDGGMMDLSMQDVIDNDKFHTFIHSTFIVPMSDHESNARVFIDTRTKNNHVVFFFEYGPEFNTKIFTIDQKILLDAYHENEMTTGAKVQLEFIKSLLNNMASRTTSQK